MNRRSITILVLIQIGLVVFGYLCTVGAVKIGYGEMADFNRAPWFLWMVRHYGWLLLLVPGLWSVTAFWCQATGRENAHGVVFVAGVALTAIIAMVFIFSIGMAAFGPPRHTLMIKRPTAREKKEKQ